MRYIGLGVSRDNYSSGYYHEHNVNGVNSMKWMVLMIIKYFKNSVYERHNSLDEAIYI